MTIQEALDKRIPRVRKPDWKGDNCYLRLPLMKDGYGPWGELYDDFVQGQVLNIPVGSQHMLIPGIMADSGYEAYTGPVSVHEQDEGRFARVYLES